MEIKFLSKAVQEIHTKITPDSVAKMTLIQKQMCNFCSADCLGWFLRFRSAWIREQMGMLKSGKLQYVGKLTPKHTLVRIVTPLGCVWALSMGEVGCCFQYGNCTLIMILTSRDPWTSWASQNMPVSAKCQLKGGKIQTEEYANNYWKHSWLLMWRVVLAIFVLRD